MGIILLLLRLLFEIVVMVFLTFPGAFLRWAFVKEKASFRDCISYADRRKNIPLTLMIVFIAMTIINIYKGGDWIL